MPTANDITDLWATRWLPCTLAVTICFGAFLIFEHRYQPRLTKTRPTVTEGRKKSEKTTGGNSLPTLEGYVEAHGFESVSAGLIAEKPDDLEDEDPVQTALDESIEAESPYRDLWTEAAEQECLETYAFKGPDEEEPGQQFGEVEAFGQTFAGTPVPTATHIQSSPSPHDIRLMQPEEVFSSLRSPHVSSTPFTSMSTPNLTAEPPHLNVATEVITNALSRGLSITINPPSDSDPNPLPRTPLLTPFPFAPFAPFGSSHHSRIPSLLIWNKIWPTPPNRVSRSGNIRPKMELAPASQMPTIAEDGSASVGLGIFGNIDESAANATKKQKRKRRHIRRGSKKGVVKE